MRKANLPVFLDTYEGLYCTDLEAGKKAWNEFINKEIGKLEKRLAKRKEQVIKD